MEDKQSFFNFYW